MLRRWLDAVRVHHRR